MTLGAMVRSWPLSTFLVVTFAFTWALHIPIFALGLEASWPSWGLITAGALGPFVGAAAVIAGHGTPVLGWLRRILRFRTGIARYLAAVGLPTLAVAAGTVAFALMGYRLSTVGFTSLGAAFAPQIPLLVVFEAIVGGGEPPPRRGYARGRSPHEPAERAEGAEMKILVAASSKYGATAEIATAIGRALEDRGCRVTVVEPDAVGELGDLDAAVVGSAVYAGQWMKPALALVERLAAELSGRPVWLFSSGPLGDPPRPEGDPPVVAELMAKVGAAGHQVFAGKLDRSRLNFAEKAIVIALRAPTGDFRDWDAIAAWAGEIADAVQGERAAVGTPGAAAVAVATPHRQRGPGQWNRRASANGGPGPAPESGKPRTPAT